MIDNICKGQSYISYLYKIKKYILDIYIHIITLVTHRIFNFTIIGKYNLHTIISLDWV